MYVLSVLLRNVDANFVSLCCPGGLSLVVILGPCPRMCSECLWQCNEELYSLKVVSRSLRTILNLTFIRNVDLVLFTGADLYLDNNFVDELKDVLIALINKIKPRVFGFKLTPTLIQKNTDSFERFLKVVTEIHNVSRLIILEIVDLNDVQTLNLIKSYVEEMKKYFLIELQLYLSRTVITRYNEVLQHLREALHDDYPLNLVPLSSIDIHIHKLADLVRKGREFFRHVYVPTSESMDLASIICPNCGMYVVFRQNALVFKVNIVDEGRCKYCGYRVLTHNPIRIVSIPINEPIR